MFARIIYLFLIVGIAVLGILNGQCIERHKQYNYCTNKDVLQVKLRPGASLHNPYLMTIQEVFKTAANVKINTDIYVSTTFDIGAVSRRSFVALGNITNGILLTTDCEGIIPYGSLTGYQKDGYIGYYNNCDCAEEIKNIVNYPAVECEYKYASRSIYNYSCTWSGLNAYHMCVEIRDEEKNTTL